MNLVFYQRFWHIVGKDVSDACLSFISSCEFSEGLNDTHIILIPKKSHVATMTKLIPISLCNVICKIVAKAVATQLKHLLPVVVSQSYSVLIPSRAITDNILMSHEVLHFFFFNRKT